MTDVNPRLHKIEEAIARLTDGAIPGLQARLQLLEGNIRDIPSPQVLRLADGDAIPHGRELGLHIMKLVKYARHCDPQAYTWFKKGMFEELQRAGAQWDENVEDESAMGHGCDASA